MFNKAVSKVGYYSEMLLRNMSRYDSFTNPQVWREITRTPLSPDDTHFLVFLFTDRDVLRIRLREITSWTELKHFAMRLKRLGRVLNNEATGENWRCYKALEDWSYYLVEFGDCVESLVEFKTTWATLQDILQVFVSCL